MVFCAGCEQQEPGSTSDSHQRLEGGGGDPEGTAPGSRAIPGNCSRVPWVLQALGRADRQAV